MKIVFTKMHALGNDFVVIDGIHQQVDFLPQMIQQWADRHRGIGFDQLLLLQASNEVGIDFIYRIYNADGSEVAQCGNGARAIAQFILQKKLSPKTKFVVKTQAGKLELIIEDEHHIKANLGIPKLGGAQQLQGHDGLLIVHTLDIGNPHAVIFVDDITNINVNKLGQHIATHTFFPLGTNVEFLQILNSNEIALRVYERGVGETQACGSGAVAAVIVGHVQKMLNKQVNVHLPGGDVTVDWAGENQPAWLIGDASTVFTGEIELR